MLILLSVCVADTWLHILLSTIPDKWKSENTSPHIGSWLSLWTRICSTNIDAFLSGKFLWWKMTGSLNNCLVKAKGEKFEMQFSKIIFCNFDESFSSLIYPKMLGPFEVGGLIIFLWSESRYICLVQQQLSKYYLSSHNNDRVLRVTITKHILTIASLHTLYITLGVLLNPRLAAIHSEVSLIWILLQININHVQNKWISNLDTELST